MINCLYYIYKNIGKSQFPNSMQINVGVNLYVLVLTLNFIDHQLARSNQSQVVLTRVSFGLSGNFSCEVTADAPSFATSIVSSVMEVVGKFKFAFIRDILKTVYDLRTFNAGI